MKFATYLINLDRATDRMEQMDNQLKQLGIPYTRISAVLGDLLEEPIDGFDESGFKIRTGKLPNKREIGCYFSHLKSMRAFLESDAAFGLILEDDACLTPNFVALLDAAIDCSAHWDLLRLSSSRDGNFIDLTPLPDGYDLAINTSVLKNTAAYLVNRETANRCIDGLSLMQRPYDVALDRDWTMGFRTACIHPFPVSLSDVPGQIPKAPRAQLYRATSFHVLHLIDRLRRSLYRKQIARLEARAIQSQIVD